MTTIVWFRQDLRLRDNPALAAAAAKGGVVPIFILEDLTSASHRRLGGAGRWWLHHSLAALRDDLGQLRLFRGAPCDLLPAIIKEVQASAVYWNRCYEPYAIARDKELKARLQTLGVGSKASTEVGRTNHGRSPLAVAIRLGSIRLNWRASLAKPVAAPLQAPKLKIDKSSPSGDRLEEWELLPTRPDWAAGWKKSGGPASSARWLALMNSRTTIFVDTVSYAIGPTFKALPGCRRICIGVKSRRGRSGPGSAWKRRSHPSEKAPASFKRGGLARIFLPSALSFSEPSQGELAPRIRLLSVARKHRRLAGVATRLDGIFTGRRRMRELWQTGWMHNRVRMVAASFLVKHLGIDRRHGEAWFWDTLLDADLANNAAGWQWIVGSGADDLRSSEFSIPSSRARSSTRTATMFAAGVRNWRAFRTSISILRPPLRPQCWIGQEPGWARTTRSRSLTLIAHARPLLTVTARSAARGIDRIV